MGILVNDKDVVVPGEVLAEGMDFVPAGDVFRDGDKLYAKKLGLVNVSGRVVKLIPLSGKYAPKKNDLVIGKVTTVSPTGWRVDINCTFDASLMIKDAVAEFVERGTDLTKFFSIGDYIMCQIINVSGPRLVDITMKGPGLRRLGPGRMIEVAPAKVPRIIGKQGSMVSMIKEMTGCRISVGQNGLVWLAGDEPDKELLAVKAIELIEEESHVTGLTDKVKILLENGK